MEYYYKLGVLIVDGCPKALRELFLHGARRDTRHVFTTLPDFLLFHQSLILQRIRYEPQRDLLYPPGGASVDPDKWDVSLLCALVQALFPFLPWKVISGTLKIQNVRNAFQHISATDTITADEFSSMWDDMDAGIMAITDHLGDSSFRKTMVDFIQDLKDRPLPLTGTNFNEMIVRLEELKSFSADVKFAAGEAHKILKRAASKTVKRSGTIAKRISMEDPRLKHMKEHMASTMKNSLSDDFNPPTEAGDIEAKLKEDHKVVICGQDSQLNLQTALFLINKMDYNLDRSVMMKKPKEWSLVCHEDVDLVVYLEPFGGPSGFRKNLAEKSVDVFTQMVDASMEEVQDMRIDIIIVTGARLLRKFKQNTNHEMTADTTVCTVGTTLEPEELSDDEGHDCDRPDCVLCSLLEQSQLYVDYWNRLYDKEDELRQAKRILEEQRIICITGTQSSSRAILAANLLSESSRRCLVLHSPLDMHHVKTKYLSYLLIEDFGGNVTFDQSLAQSWYSKFNTLLAMVEQRRVRVIFTCTPSILEECIRQLGRHDLLDKKYIIKLEQSQEEVADGATARPGTSSEGPGSHEDKPLSRWTGQPAGTRKIKSVVIKRLKGEIKCNIADMSMIGDDKFVIVDYGNAKVKLYDIDFNFLQSVSVTLSYLCVSGSMIYCLISTYRSSDTANIIVPIQFSSSPPVLTKMNELPLDGYRCHGITVCDGRVVVSMYSDSTDMKTELQILDMAGTVERKIDMAAMYGRLTSLTDRPVIFIADQKERGRVVSVNIQTGDVDVIAVVDGTILDITSDEDNNVYVSDIRGRVHVISVDGKEFTEIMNAGRKRLGGHRICYIKGKDQLLMQCNKTQITLLEVLFQRRK